MLTRRGVIAGGLALTGTSVVAMRRKSWSWPMGLQLWSVAAELGKDLPGTFARLAASGYRQAETAGWYELKPDAFAKAASIAGLTCVSAHVAMGELRKDIAAAVGQARDAGCRWLVCASPQPTAPLRPGLDWLAAMTGAMTADDWRRNGDIAQRAGEAAARAGIGFAWHNHTMEFAGETGLRGIDILLGATDAKHVSLELDLGWAAVAGIDPAAFIGEHADRVRLIHVKDMVQRPDGTRGPAVAGTGTIDWRGTLAAARKAGVQHAFVEIEAPYARPVFDELASARDFLRSL